MTEVVKKWYNVRKICPPHSLAVLVCNVEENTANAAAMTEFIQEKKISNPQIIEGLYYPSQIAVYKRIEGKDYFLAINVEKGGYAPINVTHWQYLPKTPDNEAANKNNG